MLLGAAVGSASLIGALVVGDSVRGSLHDLALQRLGQVYVAMAPDDRFFSRELVAKLDPLASPSRPSKTPAAALLKLPGTAARQDGGARANRVNVLGVPYDFWETFRNAPVGAPRQNASNAPVTSGFWGRIPSGTVVLNEALARQLAAQTGDDVVLRVHKPSALSREIPITPQSDASLALRLKVHAIVTADNLGNFSLQADQAPPLNAFLDRDDLAEAAGLKGRANVALGAFHRPLVKMTTAQLLSEYMPGKPLPVYEGFLYSYLRIRPASLRRMLSDDGLSTLLAEDYSDILERLVSFSDLELELRPVPRSGEVELRSSRIFLTPFIAASVLNPASNRSTALQNFSGQSRPLLTYLVNEIRAGSNAAPYSMVTAAGQPWTPADLRDDEIIVNQWLADDLQIQAGDPIQLTY
ncbi:MAG: putative transport system permease protein, partial [Verrucomicrobiota bacterium]